MALRPENSWLGLRNNPVHTVALPKNGRNGSLPSARREGFDEGCFLDSGFCRRSVSARRGGFLGVDGRRPVTEARRKAAKAYKERQAANGVKVVAVRLDKNAREGIKTMAKEAGVSQGEVVTQLLAYYRS